MTVLSTHPRPAAYARYVKERFGATQDMRPVPSCGHNARCMFKDNAALDGLKAGNLYK